MAERAQPRTQRKRQVTRARLLAATRTLIAEKGVEAATIARIAETADVGFGTFYLHFGAKEEAVEAVVGDIAEELGAALDRLTAPSHHPADVMAIGLRHVVARVDTDAIWAWFVVRMSAADRILAGALAGRLMRDLERGVATGRFDVDPLGLAPFAIGAIVHAAMRARLEGLLGTDAPLATAEHVLRMLGLPPHEANAIAHRPLPALDEQRTP